MKTPNRIILFVLAAAMALQAGAIDIKLKKDRATVDGVTYALNPKKQSANVVKGQEPYVGDIVIPEKITVDSITFYVEEITANAFKDSPGMTSITIPDCITKIGSSAFEGCASLTEVTIPSRILTLPTQLFMNCTSLTNIILPEGW